MRWTAGILIGGVVLCAGIARAQDACPENAPLPEVLDGTDAWCPACVTDALASLDETIDAVSTLQAGVDRTRDSIAALDRAEENGSVAAQWDGITVDDGGLTYGAYQFDRKSGELLTLLRDYVRLRDDHSVTGPLEVYVRGMGAGNVYDHSATLRLLLKQAAQDPVMQLAQEELFREMAVDPVLADAASMGVRSPLAAAIMVDLKNNGGYDSVVGAARRRVGPIRSDEDDRSFVEALLDLREARYRSLARSSRRLRPYLTGWLRRNDDFRRLYQAGNLDLSGVVPVHSKDDSFCGGSAGDAQAFRLWMAHSAAGDS
jgi:hypothetical protein